MTIWQNYVNFIYECKCKPIFFCFLTGVINLHIQFLIYLLIIASNECQKNRNLSMSNYLQNLSLILHLLECVHHFCQNIALSAASNQSHNWWHNCFSFEYSTVTKILFFFVFINKSVSLIAYLCGPAKIHNFSTEPQQFRCIRFTKLLSSIWHFNFYSIWSIHRTKYMRKK